MCLFLLKNITSNTFLLVFKIVESLQHSVYPLNAFSKIYKRFVHENLTNHIDVSIKIYFSLSEMLQLQWHSSKANRELEKIQRVEKSIQFYIT